MIELGGNIQLSGFRDIDPAHVIVVKKMVGHFVRRLNMRAPVTRLTLTLKPVHSRMVELQGFLDHAGEQRQAQIADYNLFFALDKVLTKLEGS